MICPSCRKQQPMSYRCRGCGADLLRRGDVAGARPAPVGEAPVVETDAVARPDNPYASPEAARASVSLTAAGQRLASRSRRLAAAMVDGVIALAILLPVIATLFMVEASAGAGADPSPALGLGVLLSVVLLIAFAVYQISLLIRRGQTLGKKYLKIRIVNHDDGRLPPWSKVFGVRYLVNGLIGQFVPFYAILDAAFIFGAEQRCIHDYLAGTKVVEA